MNIVPVMIIFTIFYYTIKLAIVKGYLEEKELFLTSRDNIVKKKIYILQTSLNLKILIYP